MTRLSIALSHPELRRLYAIWRKHCAGETFPMAADIDPTELRPWVANLVVIDVIKEGTFVYSYYSRSFASTFGDDRVGQSIEDLPEEQCRILKTEYDRVCHERLPASRVYRADFDGTPQTWERLVLPFFDVDGNVTKLLVAAFDLTDPLGSQAAAPPEED